MQKAPYLIAYDITDNRRRRYAHKYLTEQAIAIQGSVFVILDYRDNIERLYNKLKQKLDNETDRLLCVTLNSAGFCQNATPAITGIEIAHPHTFFNTLINGNNTED